MTIMYIFNETFTNGLSYNITSVLSILSIVSGILVIVTKNPVVSILYLIALFFTIACYLMVLGLSFIGLSYLLVYVGAVSILFLFILMLINIRVSELSSDSSNSIPLAVTIGVAFNYILYEQLPSYISTNIDLMNGIVPNRTIYVQPFATNSSNILFASTQIWDGAIAETSHITNIGNILYSNYPIWLMITSLILLLAMIGAIVVTIKQE